MENKQVKLTKVQKFNALIALIQDKDILLDVAEGVTVNTSELVEFLNHEVELLSRKRAKSSAKKNDDVMKDAIAALLSEEPQPCSYFVSALIEQGFEEVSAAKVTARLSALVRDGQADKQPIKVNKSSLQHYSVKGE